MKATIWLTVKFRAAGITFANLRCKWEAGLTGFEQAAYTDIEPDAQMLIKNKFGINLAVKRLADDSIDAVG